MIQYITPKDNGCYLPSNIIYYGVVSMFIKSTRVKDYEYINLVESYRGENGTTKHRVLYNFGRRDQLCENKSFRKIVLKLCELAEIKVLDEGEDTTSAED